MAPLPMAVRFPLIRPILPKPQAWLPYLKTAYDRHYFTNFGTNEQLLSARIAERFSEPGGEVVLTCSATAGLTATLIAMGIHGNVAIPAFTFPATLQAVIAAGCRPVLLDVDPVTWELSAQIVERAIKRTSIDAIMPVRVFGFVRDHRSLIDLARSRGVPIIFDAAAALGHARFSVGSGDDSYVEIFSLHATKSFAVGEGGAILCSPDLAQKIRRVINFGLNADRSFGDGMNAKMSEFQAAVGLAALDMLSPLLQRRQEVADVYADILDKFNSLTLPAQTALCPWSVFPVLTAEGTDVPAIVERALAAGLQLRRYYHPSLVDGYRGMVNLSDATVGPVPVTQRVSAGMICLPVYADASDHELDELLTIVTDIFSHA